MAQVKTEKPALSAVEGSEIQNPQWIDTGTPRLLATLPCEDAAVSVSLNDGRITLQRIFFDLYSDVYPARPVKGVTVVTVWSGGEAGREYPVKAVLRGLDDVVLASGALTYPARPEPNVFVGVVYLFPLLPAPGRYTIEIAVGDVVVGDIPLYAIQVKAQPETDVEDKTDES